MSQIRSALGKALPERLPAPEWDSHDLEIRAVRSTRRRRLGGGLLGVALLGLSLLAAVNLLPGLNRDTPAADPAGYPLPELDESQPYLWELDGQSHPAATEQLDRALESQLDRRHPDLRAKADIGFLRTERQLWTAVPDGGDYEAGPSAPGSKRVYRQPMYLLGAHPLKPGIEFDTGRSDVEQGLRVAVYPKGGFEPGTADVSGDPGAPPPPQYLVPGCRDYESTDRVDFECSKPETDAGEHADAVKQTVEYGSGDGLVEVNRTVVLYRADGTAVVVTMWRGGDEAADPPLSTADLLAIAEAIPDVAVT